MNESSSGDAAVAPWVVVMEAAPGRSHETISFPMMQDLLGRLREWHSSGLYHPRRYAVRLRIATVTPDEALRRAVGYHDLAARAVGLTPFRVTRAEVLTVGEFELGVPSLPVPGVLPVASPRAGNLLISNELYAATRALLHVSTGSEITDIVVHFVTAMGGSVNLGECRPAADMVALDISIGEGQPPLHALAETMSVAGMILEQSLPALVADARLALRQVDEAGG